jgi:hypothetical protein
MVILYSTVLVVFTSPERAVAFLVAPASGLSALLLKDIFTHYDPEVVNQTVILHASAACSGSRALALQST